MLGRLISMAIFFVIATGLVLHFQVEVPGFSTWIGHLPGDLILTKGKATIFLPFTTALLFSAVLSILDSLLFRK